MNNTPAQHLVLNRPLSFVLLAKDMQSAPSMQNDLHDVKIASFLLWAIIYGIGTALPLIICSIIFKRMSKQSVLYKRNVLITNGSSSLSQALCEQLIETHKCQVALLSSSDNHKNVTHRWQEAISLLECNLTNRQQLSELAVKLKKKFGTIELIIHQDSGIGTECINNHQTDHFLNQTSHDILGFVNLITCFIPCMLHQEKGQIVSIKHNLNNVKAAIESQPDYDDLVQSIFRSQTASLPNHSIQGPKNIRFTTVFSNYQQQQQFLQQTKLMPNLNLTEYEVAQRILTGIESEQMYVKIQARRNLFECCLAHIAQLASIGLDKLQLRKSQKIPIRVQ